MNISIKKVIFLAVIFIVLTVLAVISVIRFKNKFVKTVPEINVATPSGDVYLQINKLTPNPILPGSTVKYEVAVASGAVNASAVGFILQFNGVNIPTTYAVGADLPTSIPIKQFNISTNQLSFVAATNIPGAIVLSVGSQIATFNITAPLTAGTYSIISKVTTNALPSIINASDVEVLNSASLTTETLTVTNPNDPSTIGNLSVEGTLITTNDQIYIPFGQPVTLSVAGVSDVDGVKNVKFYNDTVLLGTAITGTNGVYSINYSNGNIAKYVPKVTVEDSKGAFTSKTFPYFYIRPAQVSITPNGGEFSTMPLVTITNPNLQGTVLYDFCTTNCSTIAVTKTYTTSFTALSGYKIVSFVNFAGLEGRRFISNEFTKTLAVVSAPKFSLAAGNYIYDPGTPLNNKSITLTTDTAGASIFYCTSLTLTASTCASFIAYTAPIIVNKNFKLFAKATKTGSTDSPISTAVYKILGDVNGDNTFTLTGDILPMVNALFDSTLATIIMDMNKNSVVDLIDILLLLNIILN